jgi:hypothetical protein
MVFWAGPLACVGHPLVNYVTGTTNYVIPHHIINFAKNRYHTLPQQLHYLLYITYYYSNYILSTTTIRTRSLLMIFLHSIDLPSVN